MSDYEWIEYIYEKHYKDVKMAAKRISPIYGDGDLECWSEDITQDVFLCLYKAKTLPKLRRRRSMLPWLIVTLKYKAKDYHRKKANQEILLGDLPETIPSPSYEDDFIAYSSILSHLTPEEQTIFYMYAILGYTADDIAKESGITPAACRQRIHRIRKKCKKLHLENLF